MSDAYAAPAGWYPEPDGTEGQRWWDGARWTEYATPLAAPLAAPQYPQYDAAARPRVREGTPVDTVWIWLIVLLPFVPLIPFFLWDFEGYLMRSMTDPMAQLSIYLDPWYLSTVGLSWVTYGVLVWFAFLDVTALKRLGYARQFHWAWAFLSSLVYVIGRSVVVKRQAGRGWAPMWAAIALSVVVTIGSFAWTMGIAANVVNATISSYPGL
jgi:hypothetical protein